MFFKISTVGPVICIYVNISSRPSRLKTSPVGPVALNISIRPSRFLYSSCRPICFFTAPVGQVVFIHLIFIQLLVVCIHLQYAQPFLNVLSRPSRFYTSQVGPVFVLYISSWPGRFHAFPVGPVFLYIFSRPIRI